MFLLCGSGASAALGPCRRTTGQVTSTSTTSRQIQLGLELLW